MSRISVELEDLRKAVRQCERLKQRLQDQEQQMRNIYGRLHDWKGESAVKLAAKMEAFLRGASQRAEELDVHREQLLRYIEMMETIDRYTYSH
ncbi:WXG100 family type VII secretion target [Paenibacillus sp. M1]|uniref:WXG100 family type VII secretion target n=1 Tax=Paenibacillus haidiansis TaxID=1574488 RepID=A0ABU7VXP4_9BACL